MQSATIERAGLAFRLQRRFRAPREKVFRAWTEPEVLTKGWCPDGWTPAEIEVDLRPGGAYRFGMRRPGGGESVYVHGLFLEIRAPEMLAYTWQWENAFPQMPQTRVTVEFVAAGSGTLLTLKHEDLPEIPVCLQHRGGWLAAFDRIEKIL